MTIEFDKRYLWELFETGRTGDRKHRLQPEIVRAYRKAVMFLAAAERITDLYDLHGLNYESLHGEKEGISSVRINLKYRLEFTVRENGEESIVTVCRLLDISNHYK